MGLPGRKQTFFHEGLDAGAAVNNSHGVVWHIEGLASVALRRGYARRAALLLGAAAPVREAVHVAIEPAEVPRRTREMAALEAALGTAAMESALAEGRALTRQEAIALALRDDGAG